MGKFLLVVVATLFTAAPSFAAAVWSTSADGEGGRCKFIKPTGDSGDSCFFTYISTDGLAISPTLQVGLCGSVVVSGAFGAATSEFIVWEAFTVGGTANATTTSLTPVPSDTDQDGDLDHGNLNGLTPGKIATPPYPLAGVVIEVKTACSVASPPCAVRVACGGN